MRWAVVSDIHGNLPALEAVLADARGVDGVLNLGDVLSGPLWPRETAAFVMARDWPTIAGNHERQLLTLPRERLSPADRHAAERLGDAERRWLAALPPRMAPAPGLVCVHGSAFSDLQYLLHTVSRLALREAGDEELAARLDAECTAASLLLCGHSHLPRRRRLGALQIANPGSVGLPAYDDDHPYPHVVQNGSPQARYAIAGLEGTSWRVELRAVDYDHEAAARQADRHGRGDWADALRTGFVGRREADVVAG